MRKEKLQTIVKSRYSTYPLHRLLKHDDRLSAIVIDEEVNDEELVYAALERREIRLIIQLFIEMECDDSHATAIDLIELKGLDPRKLASGSIAGEIAEDAMAKMSSALRQSSDKLFSLFK